MGIVWRASISIKQPWIFGKISDADRDDFSEDKIEQNRIE